MHNLAFKLFIGFIGLTLLFYSFVPNPDFVVRWKRSDIKIDGDYNEWRLYFDHYSSTTKTRYAMANDSTHLYLCFSNAELPSILSFLLTDIKLTVKYKERKKVENALYIHNRHKKILIQKLRNLLRNKKNLTRQDVLKAIVINHQQDSHFVTKKGDGSNPESDSPLDDIDIQMSYHGQALITEMAIPLHYFFLSPYEELAYNQKFVFELSVGIDYGEKTKSPKGIKRPKKKRQNTVSALERIQRQKERAITIRHLLGKKKFSKRLFLGTEEY